MNAMIAVITWKAISDDGIINIAYRSTCEEKQKISKWIYVQFVYTK
jgi:hypothetical protein